MATLRASSKPCKYCQALGHSAFTCPKRPRSMLITKRRMNKVGKVGKQWASTRLEWIEQNPPVKGLWECAYCGIKLNKEALTLDHIKSRSRRPDLRFEKSNLAPCCWKCNTLKGSRDVEELETK